MNSHAVATIQAISPRSGSTADSPILMNDVMQSPAPQNMKNTRRYERKPRTEVLRDDLSAILRSMVARMSPIHLRGWYRFGASPMKRSIRSARTTIRTASIHISKDVTRL